MPFWNRDTRSKDELKAELKLKAQQRHTEIKREIMRSKISISTLEQTMERKLQVAVNKAIRARENGDRAGMKNAFIDIKMAMRFKAVASATYSAMDRLESNLEFSSIAANMVETLEKAGELTGKNQMVNVGKIDSLYQKVMNPLNDVVERLGQFGEFNAEGIEGLDISDEDVERVISQVTGGRKVEVPDLDIGAAVKAASAKASEPVSEKKEATMDSVDSMMEQLDGILSMFSK